MHGDAVGFGSRGQMLFGAALRQIESVFQDAIHALTRKYRLLQHHLAFCAFKDAPAYRRIFALGIFAHHVEIDVAHMAIGERAGHAGHQAYRAQVHIFVEFATELDQGTP